jgi:hypothetical protein
MNSTRTFVADPRIRLTSSDELALLGCPGSQVLASSERHRAISACSQGLPEHDASRLVAQALRGKAADDHGTHVGSAIVMHSGQC